MQEEVWKDVVGFEQYFKVSESGEIYSKRTSKILKIFENNGGYLVFATKIGGKCGVAYCFKIHRLVAEAFLEPPDEDLVSRCSKQGYGNVIVRHRDNNKKNNHYSNLSWGTYQDNTNDYMKSGNWKPSEIPKGLNSPVAKLNAEQVKYIRDNYKPRCKTNGCRAIAKLFGVGHWVVSDVVIGKSYTDVL